MKDLEWDEVITFGIMWLVVVAFVAFVAWAAIENMAAMVKVFAWTGGVAFLIILFGLVHVKVGERQRRRGEQKREAERAKYYAQEQQKHLRQDFYATRDAFEARITALEKRRKK